MASPCITNVRKATGISADEAADVVAQAQGQYKAFIDAGQEPNTAMRTWAEAQAADLQLRNAIKKRQTAYNAMRRADMAKTIEREFKGREHKGIIALQNRAMEAQRNLLSNWMGALDAELRKVGPELVDLYVGGKLDREIASAIHKLGRGLPTDGIDGNALEIAKVLRKTNDGIREFLNRNGANIGYIEDYIFSQVHESKKIRAAGFDAWWADVSKSLDHKRTFGWAAEDSAGSSHLTKLELDIAKEWYRSLSTGNHVKVGDLATPTKLTGTGRNNIASSVSKERQIHFKDGESFYEYQSKYGQPRLANGIQATIASASRAGGVLQHLGPSWENNIQRLVDDIAATTDNLDLRERLASTKFRSRLQNEAAHMTGAANVPDSPSIATLGSFSRMWQSVTKLGGAVLSAIVDPINAGAEASAQYGKLFGSKSFMGGALSSVKGAVSFGKTRADQVRIAGRLGVAIEAMRGSMFNEFGAIDGTPGLMNAVQNAHSKFSMLGPWTVGARAGSAVYFAQNVADVADVAYDALAIGERESLRIAGIEEKEWGLAKHMIQEDAIGDTNVRLVAPDAVTNIPNDVLRQYIGNEKASAGVLDVVRDDIRAKYMQLYATVTDAAVIEPNKTTRTKMRTALGGEAKAGTWGGEAWMSILQFKSFPVAYMRQRVSRDFRLRGVNSMSEAIHKPGAWLPHMLFNVTAMTTMGYMAMSLKDIAKGRTPRDPDDPKTWVAAFLQGGAAGIWGDFLFGEMKSRFGQGPLVSLLGPTAGSINEALQVVGAVKDPLLSGEDVAGNLPTKLLRFGYNHTPFANLFYTRLALDHMFMWRALEEMNPGYQQRMKRSIKENMGQDLLVDLPGGF